MSWFGLHRPRPVRFVYADEFAQTGSTVMRGRQLADIAGQTTLGARGVQLVPMTADIRRADMFLTKGVLKSVDESTLAAWRRRGNRIFADPVDEGLSEEVVNAVDVIVAASRTAWDAYRDRWPNAEVAIVDHHVDPRVQDIMSRSRTEHGAARFGYFGERINTIRSKRIARSVEFVQVSTSRADAAWIDRLPDFNVHYAIRRKRVLDHHKPFLKGFTAAACRCVILIQDDQAEARRWLPAEYPFWLRGPVTEPTILESIEKVKSSYETDLWRLSLDIMRDIEERTSPRAIGAQLVTLFK